MENKKVFPHATLTLILANMMIFISLQATGTLETAQGMYGLRPAGVFRGNVFPLLSSMFLHADWTHLLGNMLSLLVLGIVLERRIGTKKFLMIYFLTHFMASMFDLAIRPGSWASAYGASAAVSGILGACFIGYAMEKIPLSFSLFLITPWLGRVLLLVASPSLEIYGIYILITLGLPLIAFVLAPLLQTPLWPTASIWLFFQLGFAVLVTDWGVLPIGWWAHLSGFLTGLLIVFLPKLWGARKIVEQPGEVPSIR